MSKLFNTSRGPVSFVMASGKVASVAPKKWLEIAAHEMASDSLVQLLRRGTLVVGEEAVEETPAPVAAPAPAPEPAPVVVAEPAPVEPAPVEPPKEEPVVEAKPVEVPKAEAPKEEPKYKGKGSYWKNKAAAEAAAAVVEAVQAPVEEAVAEAVAEVAAAVEAVASEVVAAENPETPAVQSDDKSA